MFSPRAPQRSLNATLSTEDLSKLLHHERNGNEPEQIGTKAIFTFGPACHEISTITSMLQAGGSCARLLLGWGTAKFHAHCLANLQAATQSSGKACGLMVETRGREIFVKSKVVIVDQSVPQYKRRLKAEIDDKIVITTRPIPNNSTDWLVPVQQPNFPASCLPGDTLILAEYLSVGVDTSTIRLSVVDISDTDVICIAMSSACLEGVLTVSHGSENKAAREGDPVLTAADMSAIKGLAGIEIDFLSLSHTQSAADVQFSRKILQSLGFANVKILAKLESGHALVSSPEIVKQADGVILSGGKLGISVQPGRLSLMQKAVVSNTNLMGKPILVTSIANSLRDADQLSRVDQNEIINAVMDGCDGLILGAVTHRGLNPVRAVSIVLHAAKNGEDCSNSDLHLAKLDEVLGGQLTPGSVEFLSSALANAVLSPEGTIKACLAFCHTGIPLEALRRCHLTFPILIPIADGGRFGNNSSQVSSKQLARLCSIYGGLIPFPVHGRNAAAGQISLSKAVHAARVQGLLGEDGSLLVALKVNNGYTIEEQQLSALLDNASDSESDLQSVMGREQIEAMMRESFQPERPASPALSTRSNQSARNGVNIPNGVHSSSQPSSPLRQRMMEARRASRPSSPLKGSHGDFQGPPTPEQHNPSSPVTGLAEYNPNVNQRQESQQAPYVNGQAQPSTGQNFSNATPSQDQQGEFGPRQGAEQLLSSAAHSVPAPSKPYQLQAQPSYPENFQVPPLSQSAYNNKSQEVSRYASPLRNLSAQSTPVPGSPKQPFQNPGRGYDANGYPDQFSGLRAQRQAQYNGPDNGLANNQAQIRAEMPVRNYPASSPFTSLREKPFGTAADVLPDGRSRSALPQRSPSSVPQEGWMPPQSPRAYGQSSRTVTPPPARRARTPEPQYGQPRMYHAQDIPSQYSYPPQEDVYYASVSRMQSGRLSQRGSQQNEAQMQGYGLNPSYSSQYLNEQAPMGVRSNAPLRAGTSKYSDGPLDAPSLGYRYAPPQGYDDVYPGDPRGYQNASQTEFDAPPRSPRLSYQEPGYGPGPRGASEDYVPDYALTQVRSVNEARSILAGSRARHSAISRPATPPASALQQGNFSLPAYSGRSFVPASPRAAAKRSSPERFRGGMRYNDTALSDLDHSGYEPRQSSQDYNQEVYRDVQASRQSSMALKMAPQSRRQVPPNMSHQRSMTPQEARNMGLPDGVPLPRERSSRSTQRAFRPLQRRDDPEGSVEGQNSNATSIPRVVGGKLVPGFQVGWRPGPALKPQHSDSSSVYQTPPESSPIEYEDSQNDGAPLQDRSRSVGRGALAYEDPDSPPRRPHKYNQSILTSSPDVYLGKSDRKRRSAKAPSAFENASNEPDPNFSADPTVTFSRHEGLSEPPSPRAPTPPQAVKSEQPRRSIEQAAVQPEIQPDQKKPAATSVGDNIQPTQNGLVNTNTSNSEGNESASVSGGNANLPVQPSTAEEKMKEYLVGEGIKRAHLRALYQKPAKPAKKSFLGKLFGGKSKIAKGGG